MRESEKHALKIISFKENRKRTILKIKMNKKVK
jgi:hypothetical protein